MRDTLQATRLSKRAFAIIFCVSLATAMGNTGMISVLPAIGRTIGIKDAFIAGIFSLSALLWAACSPMWARASDRYGRKPMMLLGLGGFMVSMLLCSLVVGAGLKHLAPPMTIFGFFLLARALFGTFGSASNPATQAYVAERTEVDERTQAMSNLAGAFGLGTVVGPFLAPLFVLPFIGLAGPMLMFGLIAAAMLVVVWRYLPEEKAPMAAESVEPAAATPAPKAPPVWRNPQIAPFLVYGFLVAVCQTAQGQTLGFLIIDKLGMAPREAQGFIAVAMMFGAVAGLLAQWGLIRMFEMTPRHLLRWGVGIAALGNLIVAASPGYWTVVVGYAVSSLGFGFARPGFTAGSSLAVEMREQARVAGAIAAVNGVNVVFAPFFVMLYEAIHPAPFLLNAVFMLAMLAFALFNPQLRAAAPNPATQADTTIATLEKSDESGGAP